VITIIVLLILGRRWIAAGDAIIVIMGMAWEMDLVGIYHCTIELLCWSVGFPAKDIWERIRRTWSVDLG